MGCTTEENQLYWKDIVIHTGYQIQRTQNPQVDMSLCLEVHQYLGNLPNKIYWPDPQ